MHKLAAICVRRPVFATMIVVALMVVGVFSFFTLGLDLFPKIDFPTIVVRVSNPGASAEEIESEITKRVEDAVNTTSGIDTINSTSVEGSSSVTIQFSLDKSGDVAAQEVRDKVNQVIPNLPETAKAPVVQKIDPDAIPIMQLVVSSPRSLREVTEIADKQIKPRLENVEGVGQIQFVGGLKREIRVLVDPEKMRAYNIAVADVSNALRQQNVDLPAGSLNAGATELSVRTLGRLVDPEQFNEIAIARRGAYVVKLRDIGRAEDAEEEPATAARLNGQPSVTLVVSKQSGENSVATADGVKDRLKEVQGTLPKDLQIRIINDQSTFIKSAVHALESHLIEGSILAAAIIFIFLANFRTTLISAIAIPTSIISSFALMAVMKLDLNQITMLALTLMVGIVVDDAIIVLENIYRFIEEKGLPPMQAAVEGTREIGLAVMATTLSLLAVFLPIGFMGGIVGRFMSSFGFTASFAIAISLLVSFTMVPMLASRFIKVPPKSEAVAHGSKDSRFFRFLDRHYTHMLGWSMAHRKSMVALSVAVSLSTVPLFILVGKAFLPSDDQSAYQISVRAPEGTSLAATLTIAERIARDVRGLPGVDATLTSVGATSGGFEGSSAQNRASIYVSLVPLDQRKLNQDQMITRARELLKKFPSDLKTSVGAAGGFGGGQASVQFILAGPDLDKLNTYSQAIIQKLKETPGVEDPDSSLVFGKPELRVEIDRQRAADLGVRVNDIAQALNTLVAGQVVSSFPSGGEQYDVRLQAAREYRSSVEGLSQLIVFSTNRQGWVPLDQVVRIRTGTAPSAIGRLNRQRQVTLSANPGLGMSQQGLATIMSNAADSLHMDAGYGAAATGTARQLNLAVYYFALAFALTFIFMYIVLAAQFESFIHPFTILLTLPLAIPFGILSLVVTGQTINIYSALGMLLLFGIVKKNAILQVDHTNGLRAKGMERYEAIIQANRDRLRPILMTTAALVAGMLPLVFSTGDGAATNRSIGVLVVGGQTFCLLLTLLAVPVFYSLFDDMRKMPLLQKIFRPDGSPGGSAVAPIPQAAVQVGTGGKRLMRGELLKIIATLVAAASMLAGEDQPPLVPPVRPFQLPPRVGVFAQAQITLEQALATALTNNNDIDASKIDREEAGYTLLGARGLVDPTASVNSQWQKQTVPIASSLGGSATGAVLTRIWQSDPMLSGALPWLGASYRADFSSQKTYTNNTFVTLNPQYPTSLNFQYTQPLWRGLRYDSNRRTLDIAKKNRLLTDEQFRQRAMQVIAETEQAYWELVYAYNNLGVQLEAVDIARQQDESNRRQQEQGLLAPIDVVAAQTQLANFELNAYTAQAALTRAENALKMLMLADRSSVLWASALIPMTPVVTTPPVTPLADAVAEAIANRPETTQVKISGQINQTDTRYYRELTKPQVDLVGAYTRAGLAGPQVTQAGGNPLTLSFGPIIDRLNTLSTAAGLDPVSLSTGSTGGAPTVLVGEIGQSLSNLWAGNFPTMQVQLRVTLPIRNRVAEANLSRSVAERRRIQNQRDQIEQAIEADVRNSMQVMQSAQLRLEAARVARESAEEQYNGEQRQFRAGTSTLFLVQQRQSTMISARSQERRAEADLGQAISSFGLATGSILRVHNINLQ